MPAFARRFRLALEARGLTLTEAAARLGMTLQSVHQYASGRKVPSLDWTFAAARRLGIDPAELDPRLASDLAVEAADAAAAGRSRATTGRKARKG